MFSTVIYGQNTVLCGNGLEEMAIGLEYLGLSV